jgi:hypothetical protein
MNADHTTADILLAAAREKVLRDAKISHDLIEGFYSRSAVGSFGNVTWPTQEHIDAHNRAVKAWNDEKARIGRRS